MILELEGLIDSLSKQKCFYRKGNYKRIVCTLIKILRDYDNYIIPKSTFFEMKLDVFDGTRYWLGYHVQVLFVPYQSQRFSREKDL